MRCCACGALAAGPISITENIHEMHCAECARLWRGYVAIIQALNSSPTIEEFRAFQEDRRQHVEANGGY